jgi:hypothetical protein
MSLIDEEDKRHYIKKPYPERFYKDVDPNKPAAPDNPMLYQRWPGDITTSTELYIDTGTDRIYDVTKVFHKAVRYEVLKQLKNLELPMEYYLKKIQEFMKEFEKETGENAEKE